MATRTSVDAWGATLCSLIGRSPNLILICLACSRVFSGVFGCSLGAAVLRLFGEAGCCPLRGDELVEPLDFALTGLEPQLMQLSGVAVERAAGPRHRIPQTFTAFLDLAAAAFQDAHT